MLKYQILPINLRLHDGEAAAGASASTTGAPGAAPQAETQIVYGKPEGVPAGLPSDTSGTPSAAADPAARAKAWAEYKTQHKDLYQQEVQQAVSQRLKTREAELRSYRDLIQPLMAQLNIKTKAEFIEWVNNDIMPKVKGSEAYKTALKEFGGDTPEDNGAEGKAPEADVQTRAAEWVTQAEALRDKLKASGDTFDLSSEMKDPKFEGYLKAGLGVEDAYRLTHFDQIVLRQSEAAAGGAKQATIEAIRSKGLNAVAEAAAKPAPPVVYKADPNKWSDDEIIAIAKRAKSGEKFTL